MKVNFKKIFAAMAATAICAVSAAGSLSASAATGELYQVNARKELIQSETRFMLSEAQTVQLENGVKFAGTAKLGNRVAAFDPDHTCGSVPLNLRRKGRVIVIVRHGVIIIIIIVNGGPIIVEPTDPRVRGLDLVNFTGFESVNAKTYGDIDRFVGTRAVTNTIISQMNTIDIKAAVSTSVLNTAELGRVSVAEIANNRVSVTGLDRNREIIASGLIG